MKHEPTFHCPICRDEPSGWRSFACRGLGPSASVIERRYVPCSRTREHHAHAYVERCGCYATNPVTRAIRERMAAAQAKRQERPRRRSA